MSISLTFIKLLITFFFCVFCFLWTSMALLFGRCVSVYVCDFVWKPKKKPKKERIGRMSMLLNRDGLGILRPFLVELYGFWWCPAAPYLIAANRFISPHSQSHFWIRIYNVYKNILAEWLAVVESNPYTRCHNITFLERVSMNSNHPWDFNSFHKNNLKKKKKSLSRTGDRTTDLGAYRLYYN